MSMTDLPDPLTAQEQILLVRKYRSGDDAAGKELVACNIRFIQSVAANYALRCNHLTTDDLTSEGVIGMMTALRRYNPDNPTRANFLTYAIHWVRQAIIRAIQQKESTIRVPNYLQTATRNPEKSKSHHNHIAEARRAMRCESLDAPPPVVNGDSDMNHYECIPAEEPEPRLIEGHSIKVLKKAIRKLNAKEKFVIERRFGLYDGDHWTLDDVAAVMPIHRSDWRILSRERIRQIQQTALRKLQEHMTGTLEEPKLV